MGLHAKNGFRINYTKSVTGITNENVLTNNESTLVTEAQIKYNLDLKASITDVYTKTQSDIRYVNITGDTMTGPLIVNSNVTIYGNLYVSGTTVTINTEDLNIKDNIILINSGETGSGVTLGSSGIEVDRGALVNYQFIFDESTETFRVGESGSTQAVATREDTPDDQSIAYWDSATGKFLTDGDFYWDVTDGLEMNDKAINGGAATFDSIDSPSISATTFYGNLDWSYIQNIKYSWQWDAGRDGVTTASIDLKRAGGIPTNTSPFISPYDATIHAVSAGADTNGTWDAEVLVNGLVVYTLSITTSTKNKATGLSVDINEDDEVILRFSKNGDDITDPSISLFLINR